MEEIRGSDLVVHTGDFTGVETLELIESIGPPLVAVHGNVDAPRWRSGSPSGRASRRAPGTTVAVVHDGGPRRGGSRACAGSSRERQPWSSATPTCPLHEQADDGFQIFNPGSPTERRRAPRHSMGIGVVDGDGLHLSHVWF